MDKLKEGLAKAKAALAPLAGNSTKSHEHRAILALIEGIESTIPAEEKKPAEAPAQS